MAFANTPIYPLRGTKGISPKTGGIANVLKRTPTIGLLTYIPLRFWKHALQ